MKIKIVFEEVTLEEAQRILGARANMEKKGIDKWPYWCWNCHFKIESAPKPDARGDLLCPSCGLIIPEP